MESNRPVYWFPVKRYGFAWGLPIRWQGWLVLGIYFAALYLAYSYFRQRGNITGFLECLVVLTVLLVSVIAWKGEKPLAWRWGRK